MPAGTAIMARSRSPGVLPPCCLHQKLGKPFQGWFRRDWASPTAACHLASPQEVLLHLRRSLAIQDLGREWSPNLQQTSWRSCPLPQLSQQHVASVSAVVAGSTPKRRSSRRVAISPTRLQGAERIRSPAVPRRDSSASADSVETLVARSDHRRSDRRRRTRGLGRSRRCGTHAPKNTFTTSGTNAIFLQYVYYEKLVTGGSSS